MEVTNWLKEGRTSKKDYDATINVHCNTKGGTPPCVWGDYVQITIRCNEKNSFMRVTMSVEEAKKFQEDFNKGMKSFD